jgi:hypothetical protein
MSLICAICEQEFADIPDGAVELAPRRRGRRSYLYRFSNGAIHDLRAVAKPEPPIMAKPEPPVVEQTQEVVEVLTELPQPELAKPEVTESEIEESSTSMQMAFKQFQNAASRRRKIV